jgi:hypothetical protein
MKLSSFLLYPIPWQKSTPYHQKISKENQMNAINSWIKRNPFGVIVICIALIIPVAGVAKR